MMVRAQLFLAAAVLAQPAAAASLRMQTTLAAPVVRLSDLFEDAGAAAGQVLGPAPAPGVRIVIEARQLAAIARQFDVDWRPASGAERVVLDRPGRMLPREDVLAALRVALQGLGVDPSAEVELQGYAAPLLPSGAQAEVSVEQIDQDSSGHFTAAVAVLAPEMEMQRLRVAGAVVQMVEVAVPVRRLAPGAPIGPDDVRMARVRGTLVRGTVAQNVAQVVGLTPRYGINQGQPMVLAELARPLAVVKGATVVMQLTAPGVQLLGQGRALEQGGIGDRIQVLNPASRAIVEAEIIGRDRVRVAPGSTPLQQGGAQVVAFR